MSRLSFLKVVNKLVADLKQNLWTLLLDLRKTPRHQRTRGGHSVTYQNKKQKKNNSAHFPSIKVFPVCACVLERGQRSNEAAWVCVAGHLTACKRSEGWRPQQLKAACITETNVGESPSHWSWFLLSVVSFGKGKQPRLNARKELAPLAQRHFYKHGKKTDGRQHQHNNNNMQKAFFFLFLFFSWGFCGLEKPQVKG